MLALCAGLAGIAVPWPNDPTTNLPVCAIPYSHESPQICSDGAGGAIIVWEDLREFCNFVDIYAQRVSAAGQILWTADGIPVSMAAEWQQSPRIVSDGAGGAIIAWMDFRDGMQWDIYAQRVDAFGNLLWDTIGVAICTAVEDQQDLGMVSDGAGGAIVAWADFRTTGVLADVYAQRVDAGGSVLWTGDGVPVSMATRNQVKPRITTDGNHGAIIVWEDWRSASDSDIYTQRINANGSPVWTSNGVPVCALPMLQSDPQPVSDGTGGAITAWGDERSDRGDIFVQRMDSTGAVKWLSNGIGVCTAALGQIRPKMLEDGSGGAIICWPDDRNDYSLYANRIDAMGHILWASDGIPICQAAGSSDRPQIVSDGNGGAIIAWEDTRNVPFQDIYAQRVDADGVAKWPENGVPVTTAVDRQLFPMMVADGLGGVIVTWEDWRQGGLEGYYYIYAQRVDSTGTLSTPTGIQDATPPGFELSTPVPNPTGGVAELCFYLPAPSEVAIEIYDVLGRRLKSERIGLLGRGQNQYIFDGKNDMGNTVPSGVYFARVSAGGLFRTQKFVISR